MVKFNFDIESIPRKYIIAVSIAIVLIAIGAVIAVVMYESVPVTRENGKMTDLDLTKNKGMEVFMLVLPNKQYNNYIVSNNLSFVTADTGIIHYDTNKVQLTTISPNGFPNITSPTKVVIKYKIDDSAKQIVVTLNPIHTVPTPTAVIATYGLGKDTK